MEQEPKTPRERADDLISLLVSDWRPTRQQVVWGIRIVLAFVIVLGILTLIGRPFDISLWQWLDLLIIPVVLAVGGYLFTRSENRATRAAAERRAQEEALQAYLDNMSEMLIPHNDQPSLSDEHPPDSLRTVARARTLTVLPRLAGDGKGRVVQFLHESNLIARKVRDEQFEVVQDKVVDLSGADLRDADLSGLNLRGVALDAADLRGANLSGASLREADLGTSLLSGAYLSRADLSSADLSRAYLSRANLLSARLSNAYLPGANLSSANLSSANANMPSAILSGADLSIADLSSADLSRAYLSRANLLLANLSGADLSNAHLSRANLWRADITDAHLSRASLSHANLSEAKGWTEEQLDQAGSLDGATMPDGQVLKGPERPNGPTFTEWLKSQEGQG